MKFHAATTTLLTGRDVPSFIGHTSSTHHEMRGTGTVGSAGIDGTASGKEQVSWQTTDVVIITSEKRDSEQWSHPITTSTNSGTSNILQRRRWGRRGRGQGQGRRHLTKVLQSMEDDEPSFPRTLKNLKNVRLSSREGSSIDSVIHNDHTEVGEKNPKVDVIAECDLTAADIGILACPGENEICVPRIPGLSNLGGICIEEPHRYRDEQERQLQQTMTPTTASTGFCNPSYCDCANYDIESSTGSFSCTDNENVELCPDSGILLTTVATYNAYNATFLSLKFCVDLAGSVNQDLCVFYYYDDAGNYTCQVEIDNGEGAATCDACFQDEEGYITSFDCTNVPSYNTDNNERDFEIICQCEDALDLFPVSDCSSVIVPDDGSGGGGGASGGNGGNESSSTASSVVIVATMITTIGTAIVLAAVGAIAS